MMFLRFQILLAVGAMAIPLHAAPIWFGSKAVGGGAPRPAAALTVASIRGGRSDLAAYQLVDRSNGAVLRVYYDAASRETAKANIPYLASMINEVARLAQADPGQVIWSSVVFSTDAEYIPPRSGSEVRWAVLTAADGSLTKEGEKMLFEILPHEQVHAVHGSFQPSVPRWFAEGVASWIGQQVTKQTRPDLGVAWRNGHLASLKAAKEPLKLAAWGGITIKREAILRQVSAEERAKMESDPTYAPPGPFQGGPGDLVSDESNTSARYGAALTLFEMLDRTAGRPAMNNWLRAVWREPSAPSTQRIVALTKQKLKLDIDLQLR